MTVENWNDVLYITMSTGINKILTVVFLILWIFIGNYIFLNLIMAIILD